MEKLTYIISQAKILDVLDDIYSFYEKKGFLGEYRDALEFKSQRTTFALSKPLDLRGEKAEDRNL